MRTRPGTLLLIPVTSSTLSHNNSAEDDASTAPGEVMRSNPPTPSLDTLRHLLSTPPDTLSAASHPGHLWPLPLYITTTNHNHTFNNTINSSG